MARIAVGVALGTAVVAVGAIVLGWVVLIESIGAEHRP